MSFVVSKAAARSDINQLLSSLTALVQALGIADYEAEYILEDARRSSAQPAIAESYETRLRTLQATHDERMAAIRALPAIDQDTQEQLLESEQMRFRTAMLELSGEGD